MVLHRKSGSNSDPLSDFLMDIRGVELSDILDDLNEIMINGYLWDN